MATTTTDIETETRPELSTPTKPAELWLLWDIEDGEWVRADGLEPEPLLALESHDEAVKCATYLFDKFELRSRPYRVR